MSKKYVIDACALINASKNYNMTKKAFSHIWQAFNELVENGQLISSSEIFEELKDDDIVKWAKEHKDAFLPLSKEVQLKTTEILQQFPQIIKIQTKGSSNGDPFLIATAILEDGIISCVPAANCYFLGVVRVTKVYIELHASMHR